MKEEELWRVLQPTMSSLFSGANTATCEYFVLIVCLSFKHWHQPQRCDRLSEITGVITGVETWHPVIMDVWRNVPFVAQKASLTWQSNVDMSSSCLEISSPLCEQTLSQQTEMSSPWVSMSSLQVATSSQVITYYVPESWPYIIKWTIIIPGANEELRHWAEIWELSKKNVCSFKNRPIDCMKTSWSRAALDDDSFLKLGSGFRF